MTICARFICRDSYDAKRDLEEEKKHWNREIIGTMWKVFKSWFGASKQADRDSTAQLDDINAAIAASAAGMAFGHATDRTLSARRGIAQGRVCQGSQSGRPAEPRPVRNDERCLG